MIRVEGGFSVNFFLKYRQQYAYWMLNSKLVLFLKNYISIRDKNSFFQSNIWDGSSETLKKDFLWMTIFAFNSLPRENKIIFNEHFVRKQVYKHQLTIRKNTINIEKSSVNQKYTVRLRKIYKQFLKLFLKS